jgi:type II secretory pathway component PulJ
MKYHHNNQLVAFVTQEGKSYTNNTFTSCVSKFLEQPLNLEMTSWDHSMAEYSNYVLENQLLKHKSGIIPRFYPWQIKMCIGFFIHMA